MLILFLSVYSFNSTAQDCLIFTENKGQWNDKVLFETHIPSGVLYLEKNCFTYYFVDKDDMSRCHGCQKHSINSPPPEVIHYHSYRVNFINSKPAPQVIGQDKLSYYFNYYIGNNPEYWSSGCRNYKGVKYL